MEDETKVVLVNFLNQLRGVRFGEHYAGASGVLIDVTPHVEPNEGLLAIVNAVLDLDERISKLEADKKSD